MTRRILSSNAVVFPYLLFIFVAAVLAQGGQNDNNSSNCHVRPSAMTHRASTQPSPAAASNFLEAATTSRPFASFRRRRRAREENLALLFVKEDDAWEEGPGVAEARRITDDSETSSGPSPLPIPTKSRRRRPKRRPFTTRNYFPPCTIASTVSKIQPTVTHVAAKTKTTSNKAWPPWPFNLLTSSPKTEDVAEGDGSVSTYSSNPRRSGAVYLWSLANQSVRVGMYKMRVVTSQLAHHLPPAAPPLLLWAALPRRSKMLLETSASSSSSSKAVATAAYKTVVPLFSNPWVRHAALASLGLAIFSWSHDELHRRRRLAPLPLAPPYRDVNRVVLPPFLPEVVPHLDNLMPVVSTSSSSSASSSSAAVSNTLEDEEDFEHEKDGNDYENSSFDFVSPKLQKHWLWLKGMAPKPSYDLQSTWRAWKNDRLERKWERQAVHRAAVMDQLVALQMLKQKSREQQAREQHQRNNRLTRNNKSKSTNSSSNSVNIHNDDKDRSTEAASSSSSTTMGYAMVTGASRGIGRALAVQLARFEIPLILVARDMDRLTALAYDLQACYGVPCVVLKADLSQPDAPQRIHATTEKAGLRVDVLVNNAGYTVHGLSVDMPVPRVRNMIQLNALAPAELTHLYGRDMMQRRRGRILTVSSICGAVAGLPSVAVYAATKAFENTLSQSVAKELEPYGVGMTCVMPGAVRDTEFKARSDTGQALCWHIPFYTRTAQQVAEIAVLAMLRGDPESTPGWQNRLFLQVMKPALPQRMHNIIAEIAWNPLRLPFQSSLSHSREEANSIDQDNDGHSPTVPQTPPKTQSPLKPLFQFQNPPRQLGLVEDSPPPAFAQNTEGDNDSRGSEEQDEPISAAPEVESKSTPLASTPTPLVREKSAESSISGGSDSAESLGQVPDASIDPVVTASGQ